VSYFRPEEYSHPGMLNLNIDGVLMIDFNSLGAENTIDTIVNPRDLFAALPSKDAKYQYPRDVQGQVWNKWFEKKDDENIIIKMNTGGGKTVVGLIILKSSLNENIGPAVYVVPDNFLVDQVINEANALGIPVTTDERSFDFISGRSILVCNIHKLINGRSVFGVNERKIEIGSIIIDDAHACLDTVESQFTLTIPSNSDLYKELLELFLPSIKQQSASKAIELENSQPNTLALVPFWSWQNNLSSVQRILIENQADQNIEWQIPLLKEKLKLCRCAVTDKKIEITPHMIPIDVIPSLESTKRKIFMTATLVDDSILSTHFDLDPGSLSNCITPDTASDIGDRMIFLPQKINPDITDDELKEYYKRLSENHNVVVIVPSFYRKRFWENVADMIIDSDNMQENINRLKSEHVGLAILVNRYDGIDLPHDACRVLVIDSLPDARRAIDQIAESQLQGSQKAIAHKIQKIEQGMGRGVRSNDDFCLIFLMGNVLISNLYQQNALDNFSSSTKAQFELSESLSKQVSSLEQINEAAQSFLSRDESWVKVSKGKLVSLTYSESRSDKFAIAQRLAFNEASINQFGEAVDILNNSINNDISDSDKIFKGYGKQILSEYINLIDPVESQKVLLSAIRDNKSVLKPKTGIDYERITSTDGQINRLQTNLIEKYPTGLNNQYIIDLESILDDLVFRPDTANKFEEAMKLLAFYLGFVGQRPENDYGRGPDNLWALGNNEYFIIECKNGVTNEIINKHDINQLNGSIEWFKEKYDHSSKFTPIMIHLGTICEYSATPNETSCVITKDKLEEFKENIKNFSVALKGININDDTKIRALIIESKLRPNDIIEHYTIKIRKRSSI